MAVLTASRPVVVHALPALFTTGVCHHHLRPQWFPEPEEDTAATARAPGP